MNGAVEAVFPSSRAAGPLSEETMLLGIIMPAFYRGVLLAQAAALVVYIGLMGRWTWFPSNDCPMPGLDALLKAAREDED